MCQKKKAWQHWDHLQQTDVEEANLDADGAVVEKGPEGDTPPIHALLPCLVEAICGVVDVIVAAQRQRSMSATRKLADRDSTCETFTMLSSGPITLSSGCSKQQIKQLQVTAAALVESNRSEFQSLWRF